MSNTPDEFSSEETKGIVSPVVAEHGYPVIQPIDKLAKALAKAQGAMRPCSQSGENPHFRSKYATLEAIVGAIREPFAANGLSYIQMAETDDNFLRLRTILYHESGQSKDCGQLCGRVDVINPQKIGSMLTYFRRYSLSALAGVVSNDDPSDDDGNAAAGQAPPEPVQLTPDEAAAVQDAIEKINACTTSAELTKIGLKLVEEPKVVQDKVRDPVYRPKKRALEAAEKKAAKDKK